MAKKLKTYNVEVKALKTAPEVNLRLDFLKKGEKIYELVKLLENNLRIMLTDSKYKMSQLFMDDCKERTSFPMGDYATDCLTTMSRMFYYCRNLTSLDVSNFNTSNVTNMNGMFGYCKNLTSLDLSNFNTSSVTDMSAMFNACDKLTSLDLSNFNTSSVTDMSAMFNACDKLTSLDLSNFNTSSVTNMNVMFGLCPCLTALDLSSFDTSNVTKMAGMFMGCQNLTEIKGIIDMKSCTSYPDMFADCNKLSGVKIKNPPEGFTNHDVNTGLNSAGLRADQYEIVQ